MNLYGCSVFLPDFDFCCRAVPFMGLCLRGNRHTEKKYTSSPESNPAVCATHIYIHTITFGVCSHTKHTDRHTPRVSSLNVPATNEISVSLTI